VKLEQIDHRLKRLLVEAAALRGGAKALRKFGLDMIASDLNKISDSIVENVKGIQEVLR